MTMATQKITAFVWLWMAFAFNVGAYGANGASQVRSSPSTTMTMADGTDGTDGGGGGGGGSGSGSASDGAGLRGLAWRGSPGAVHESYPYPEQALSELMDRYGAITLSFGHTRVHNKLAPCRPTSTTHHHNPAIDPTKHQNTTAPKHQNILRPTPNTNHTQH
jgi:hypothetical protein